jgi:hypothetical protein
MRKVMAIQIIWDNEEKTILRHVYTGQWTWEEMRQQDAEVQAMLSTVSHPVDMIIDMRDSFFLPRGPTIGNLRNAEAHLPANARSIVLVGSNILVLLISRVMRLIPSTASRRFYIAASLEEARDIIAKIPHPAAND